MSTNTALDQIKKRAEINRHLGKTAAQDEARDTLKLIAVVEDLQAIRELLTTSARVWGKTNANAARALYAVRDDVDRALSHLTEDEKEALR